VVAAVITLVFAGYGTAAGSEPPCGTTVVTNPDGSGHIIHVDCVPPTVPPVIEVETPADLRAFLLRILRQLGLWQSS
jgi:hypothetical protein